MERRGLKKKTKSNKGNADDARTPRQKSVKHSFVSTSIAKRVETLTGHSLRKAVPRIGEMTIAERVQALAGPSQKQLKKRLKDLRK